MGEDMYRAKEARQLALIARRKRLERLAIGLRMTPPEEGRGLRVAQDHDRRWWLCGCAEGDAVLPRSMGVPTEQAALEAAEAWLDELAAQESGGRA